MWIDALAAAVLLLTLPGTAYLALLTLAALLPQRARPGPARPAPRIAIVVPAHNEGAGLLRTLRSLQAACAGDDAVQIHVVADNCSDDTAAQARAAGVQVLERQDGERRGKGYALEHAFERITDADWFIVIDADTDVAPGLLQAFRAQMHEGVAALQCRYLVRDALLTRRGTLSEVAWAAWNVLRPRGRQALGLSVGILGNGFALSRRTLDWVPYTARSIVEDVEYHILLVRQGLRVHWVDGTVVRGDMPVAAAAAGTQRARWEGGRLRLALDRVPGLLGRALAGRWRLLDPALDLLLLPLALHVSLVLLALLLAAVPAGSVALLLAAVPAGSVALLALASLAVVAVHVASGLWLIGGRRGHWLALARAPGYIVWKLLLTVRIVKAAGRQTEWVRSERKPHEGGPA